MGEVYLVQDTRLGRKVALKLLPEAYTKDSERLRRFEQEARAASALNHPNIVTIYETGRVADAQFITTEFVDGETLREHVAGSALGVEEALMDYARLSPDGRQLAFNSKKGGPINIWTA